VTDERPLEEDVSVEGGFETGASAPSSTTGATGGASSATTDASAEGGQSEASQPEGGRPESGQSESGEPEDAMEARVAELTDDLQRLQAEFVNYKRRVERDRALIKENATYAALTPIVDVLDAIDRAREHAQSSGSELDPGFRAVADQLEQVVAGVGLIKFGAPGDVFDPTLHDALSHIGEDPEVQVTTCKVIAKAGYRIGDRVVRAAQVLVVDPPAGE